MYSYPSPASSWDASYDDEGLDLSIPFSQEEYVDSNENYFDCHHDLVSPDASSGIQVSSNATGSRKRKQQTPKKSPPFYDPDFRGVTFTMDNRRRNGEWKLVINASYTLSPRKRRCRRTLSDYIDSADEDDAFQVTPYINGEKHCASCSVKKTPLWRDAEDGTPLCNACGIRYKKYKIRCGRCWHIPKKDEFSPTCKFCGACFQFIGVRS